MASLSSSSQETDKARTLFSKGGGFCRGVQGPGVQVPLGEWGQGGAKTSCRGQRIRRSCRWWEEMAARTWRAHSVNCGGLLSAEWENCAVVLPAASRPQPLSLAAGCSHCPQIFPQPHGESGAHGSTLTPYTLLPGTECSVHCPAKPPASLTHGTSNTEGGVTSLGTREELPVQVPQFRVNLTSLIQQGHT